MHYVPHYSMNEGHNASIVGWHSGVFCTINICIKYKIYYKGWIKYFVIVIVIGYGVNHSFALHRWYVLLLKAFIKRVKHDHEFLYTFTFQRLHWEFIHTDCLAQLHTDHNFVDFQICDSCVKILVTNLTLLTLLISERIWELMTSHVIKEWNTFQICSCYLISICF